MSRPVPVNGEVNGTHTQIGKGWFDERSQSITVTLDDEKKPPMPDSKAWPV